MLKLSSFDKPCPDCRDDLMIVKGLPNDGVLVVCKCGYAEYGIQIEENIHFIERTPPPNEPTA